MVKARHAAKAFSGEGAFRYGGRWNSVGTRMVYLAQTHSLAALEILVHLPNGAPIIFSTFRLTIPDKLVEALRKEDLPEDWQSEPTGTDTQMLGDEWVRESRSAVLAVPSAIIPAETNYLLNPLHSDFAKIKIDPEAPFAFDPRLLKK